MDADQPTSVSGRPNARRWLLAAIGVLYLLSVPWYRAADPSPPLWLGLPNWVTVALLCYAAVAVLNAIAWALTPIDDDAPVDLGTPAADEAKPR